MSAAGRENQEAHAPAGGGVAAPDTSGEPGFQTGDENQVKVFSAPSILNACTPFTEKDVALEIKRGNKGPGPLGNFEYSQKEELYSENHQNVSHLEFWFQSD